MGLEVLGYDDSRTLEKKRKQILAVSRGLFIEKGIDQISMKLIAQKSGTTRRSLYNYYISKEKIAVDVQILNLKELNFFNTWGNFIFNNDLSKLLGRISEITKQAQGEFNEHYVLINRFDSYFNKGYPDAKYLDFMQKEAGRAFPVDTDQFHSENFRTELFQSNLLLSYIQRLSVRSMNDKLSYCDAMKEIALICKLIFYSTEQ